MNRARVLIVLATVRGRLWRRRRRLRHRLPGSAAADRAGDAAQAALRGHSEGARHSGLQLREDRRRARRRRSSATSRCSGTRPASADQLKQKEILESFITQRVDGIAISALNGDFLTETINRAIDAGIPVVTWDSDAPKSKRIAFYGVDDLASGRIMGEQAIKLLNGKGKVAIITSLGATNLQSRLDGVKEALAKAPGIEIVETYDIKEDSVRCAEIIATGTRRYPDLAAWISVGGWPVFTRNALAARRSGEDEGHLVRHHQPGARPAARGQGPGAARPEVLRLGQRVGEAAARHQERQDAAVADHRLRRRRRHEGQRRRVRAAVEEDGRPGKLRPIRQMKFSSCSFFSWSPAARRGCVSSGFAQKIKLAVADTARPLPLTAVRLTGGPLKKAQDLDAAYLLSLEPDRMLAFYRKRAGLPPKAEGYTGWDADGRQLTGHIAGHHLSAVSLMWAATGDARFKQRADYIVSEMKAVQDATATASPARCRA